jgi:hypothetical protein
VRVGAGVEGSDDAVLDVVVVGELGQVLVGEVGSAVQLSRGQQAEDLALLALVPAVEAGGCVVVALGLHELMVVGGAGGSLSIDWRVGR